MQHKPSSHDTEAEPFYTAGSAEALRRLVSSETGLSSGEAANRLRLHGSNALRINPPISAMQILVDQFRSLVVLLLATAAAIAWLLGDPVESIAILAVIVINTAIGFTTEIRARRAVEALRRLQVPTAHALRDGQKTEISASDLVVGDILLLEAGQLVPADARLLRADELRVVEASLTGESFPVDKTTGEGLPMGVPLAERTNMLYLGTAVVTGEARAVVVATGAATEVGKIGALTSGVHGLQTPLERKLDALGRRLVGLALGVAGLVVASGLLRGEPLGRMLETGVALAIAAVPEGLPVVATVALAVGVWRMARRNALVRSLPAVEALGSTTVICTDKTGTLTAGEMTVTRIVLPDDDVTILGAGYTPHGEFLRNDSPIADVESDPLTAALRIGVLVNRAEISTGDGRVGVLGDPTEAALLVAGLKAGMDRGVLIQQMPELSSVPFSSDRQWMSTTHRMPDGATRTMVKGAPERIIKASAWMDVAGEAVQLTDEKRGVLLGQNRELAASGLRVLAVANSPASPTAEGLPEDLCFVGLFGLEDLPAPGVLETITAFHNAGIRTLMITGDQRLTAQAVAQSLGLSTGEETVVDGPELAGLSAPELAERLTHVGTISRIEPKDKLRIVEALQACGEIVAMLGDGVNDAAALKRADIGVAMGIRGTDVAKEAAAVVLQDDQFPTIRAAIEEGRVIYDNIRHFVFYLFSCNVAEVLVILIAGVASLPQPLLPLQILWLNLVTDTFPALSLAVEPGEEDIMSQPPRRPEDAMLSAGFVRSILFYSGLITLSTLGAYLWSLNRSGVPDTFASTVAFMTLAFAQLFHLGTARSVHHVLSGSSARANRWAIAAVALVAAIQLLAIYWSPLAGLLDLHPLTPTHWAVVLAFASVPSVIGQGVKFVRDRQSSG